MVDLGHSKDHRPDLKQLVLELNIVDDGAVPIAHQICSGNRSDDSVHISDWGHLRRILQTSDSIFTVGTKLFTNMNLRHVKFYQGR